MVLEIKALVPTAVLACPVVLALREPYPTAVFAFDDVEAKF